MHVPFCAILGAMLVSNPGGWEPEAFDTFHFFFFEIRGSMLVGNPGGWEPEALDTCLFLCNYGFDSGFETRGGGSWWL